MRLLFLTLTICCLHNLAIAQEDLTPLDIVNIRMQAHNDHDMDRFLSVYAEDIKIFNYPNTQINAGKENICRIFADRFISGELSVEIHHQIAKDSFVLNHETVTSEQQETEYVSIYEVRDGLIRNVTFVRD